MSRKIVLIIAATALLMACGGGKKEQPQAESNLSASEAFMLNLARFCGQIIEGEIFADQSNPGNNGLSVAFHFSGCSEDEIRITLPGASDVETTIILTRINGQLLLKHDVRNKDLSPAIYTMYGGFSSEAGNDMKQVFPIHNFGREMWPEYENYYWEICINDDEGQLEYLEVAENIVMKQYLLNLPDVN
jgi:hypothetical protein